jgi:MSHA biogenesis protein MshJ
MISFQTLSAQWGLRTSRERLLILVSILLLLWVFLQVLVIDPVVESKKEIRRGNLALHQQLAEAREALLELSALAPETKRIALESRHTALKAQLEQAALKLDQVTSKLVSPRMMGLLLQSLVTQSPGMTVHKLDSYTRPALFKSGNLFQLRAGQREDNPAEVDKSQVWLYQHGVILELEADYFTLMDYLKALQDSQWLLFWHELHYEVIRPPKARIRLDIYTLGQSEEWIGV